jgi:hypothetical protein
LSSSSSGSSSSWPSSLPSLTSTVDDGETALSDAPSSSPSESVALNAGPTYFAELSSQLYTASGGTARRVPRSQGALYKSLAPRPLTTAPALAAVAPSKLHAGPWTSQKAAPTAPPSAKSVKSLAQGPWTSQKAAPTAPPSALSVKSLAQGPWTSQKAAPTAPLGGGTAPQLPRLPL